MKKLEPFKLYRHDLGDYMRRWVLLHPLGTVRIHHIFRGDADLDPHDHPWSFVSIILAGSYVEELWTDEPAKQSERTPRRWWPRFIKSTQLHRLRLERPVWTLVITGRKLRSWGFQTVKGWIPWKTYNSKKVNMVAYEEKIKEVYG